MIGRYVREDVDGFLADHGLTLDDIGWWVCHPGGPKVIEALQAALGLPARPSRSPGRSLAAIGNLSSASVLHVLEDTLRERPPAPGQPRDPDGDGPGLLLRAGPAARRRGAMTGARRVHRRWSGWSALERLAELVVSTRNAGLEQAQGGVETGLGHYPFMVVLHTGLLVGALVEAWTRRPDVPSALAWSMLRRRRCSPRRCAGGASRRSGRRWNTRVIVVPGLRAGHRRARTASCAPQLRRRRRRGGRAAAGARVLDHRGRLHRAQRRAADGPDPGGERRPGAPCPTAAASA